MVYERILRDLAPYLAYDKLLLFCAYYHESPLLEELRDPQGPIWVERIFMEAGVLPEDFGPFGARYYSQWTSQRLLPWGFVTINDLEVPIRAFSASVLSSLLSYPKFLRILKEIWAVTPRGLELCTLIREYEIGQKIPEIDLPEEIMDPKNWEVLSFGEFQYVASIKIGHALSLDRWGVLRLHSIEEGEMTLLRGVRFFRKIPSMRHYYGIDFEGNSFTFDPKSLKVIPGVSHYYEKRQLENFESYGRTKSGNYELSPNFEVLEKIERIGHFLPRGIMGGQASNQIILGTDGRLYRDITIYKNYQTGRFLELIDYNVVELWRIQGRYQFYTQSGAIFLGIQWH